MGSSEPPRRARRPWRQGFILLTKPAAGPSISPVSLAVTPPGLLRRVSICSTFAFALQATRRGSCGSASSKRGAEAESHGQGRGWFCSHRGRLRLVPAPGTARAALRPRLECRRPVYISAQRAVFSVQARDTAVLLPTWLLLVGGAKRGVSLGAARPIPRACAGRLEAPSADTYLGSCFAAAAAAGPAHPVPSSPSVRAPLPRTSCLPESPTSHTRQAELDLSVVVFWGNLRPTFPNPLQPFPPHDSLESLLTTFGALSGSHFRGKLKLKSAAQGPGVFAPCRERYNPDLSRTVSLRLSTSAPSPPKSSLVHRRRHLSLRGMLSLPAMNLASPEAVPVGASRPAPGAMLTSGSHTLAQHPLPSPTHPTQASTRSLIAPYWDWDPSSSSSSSSCYPLPLLP